jgi:hypothetical protein
MSATVPSSLIPPPPRIRHLAHEVYQLGPDILAYLFAGLVAASSGALDQIEQHAGLTTHAELIAAYAVRQSIWRVR